MFQSMKHFAKKYSLVEKNFDKDMVLRTYTKSIHFLAEYKYCSVDCIYNFT